jgi:site-specific recombinase XerD
MTVYSEAMVYVAPDGAHPDFGALVPSWELGLQVSRCSPNTVKNYIRRFENLARWAATERPDLGPLELTRHDLQVWVKWLLDTMADSSAAANVAGVKSFYRWAASEGEIAEDPMRPIATPRVGKSAPAVVPPDVFRRLLEGCDRQTFTGVRDEAILRVLVDCGLRVDEVSSRDLASVDLPGRLLRVVGKGARREGPRVRTVACGVKTAAALDRYIRTRRKVPGAADQTALWVISNGRPFSRAGIQQMIKRRGEAAGFRVYPHMFRHTWASDARKLGLSDGDLMYLAGWESRAMLDRYGAAEAEQRAQESYRSRSVGDQY